MSRLGNIFSILVLVCSCHGLSAIADSEPTIDAVTESVKAVRQPFRQENPTTAPGRRVALLISVDEYHYGLKKLNYCNKDMERLELTLRLAGYDKVVRIYPEAQTSNLQLISVSNIKGVLDELLRAKPRAEPSSNENDLLLIAFSGHGIQKNERRYLCPPDTQSDFKEAHLTLLYEPDPEKAAQSPGILNYVMDDFKGQCVLLIDACRNGAEAEEIKAQNEISLPRNKRLHIFSSCRAGQVSYEEDRLGHGRFMYYVITGLAGGAADDRGTILLRDLEKYVFDQMKAFEEQPVNRGRPQKPAMYSGGETSELLIGQKDFSSRSSFSDEIAFVSPEKPVSYTTLKPVMDSTKSTRSDVPVKRSILHYPQVHEDREILADIVQLPGLNGEWWFQEMPWYLPAARMAFAKVLTTDSRIFAEETEEKYEYGFSFLGKNPYAYLNTNTANVKKLFWNHISSEPISRQLKQDGIWKLIDELHRHSTTPMERQQRYAFFLQLDQHMEELCGSKNRETSSLDLYTRAVFRHQMAILADLNDKSRDIAAAKRLYLQTLDRLNAKFKKLDRREIPYYRLFQQLCLADYCRFLAETIVDYDEYSEHFRLLADSLKEEPKNTLFQIALHTGHAKHNAEHRKIREASAAFREALRRIEDSRINRTAHPLEANYYEQSGWFRIDYWRITRAREDFKSALLIRAHNEWGSDNPIDTMYVTYGLHGRATINHFSGDDRAAVKDFKLALEMLKRIQTSMSKEGQAFFKPRLDEREASTLERMADICLYHYRTENSPHIPDGVSLYEKGANVTNRSTTKIRLKSKQAILLAYRKQFTEARECLKEVEEHCRLQLANFKENAVIPMLFFRAAAIQIALCEAVEEKDAERFVAARQHLRAFLDRFMLFSNSVNGIHRDVMELRLLCSERLIDADLAMNDLKEMNRDLDYLSRCVVFLSEKDGMQKYLRRYFEKIILVRRLTLEKTDKEEERQALLRSIALSVQRMRNVSTVLDMDQARDSSEEARPFALAKGGTADEPGESNHENTDPSPQTEDVIVDPTRNHLIDEAAVVVFFFPSDDLLEHSEAEPVFERSKGIAIIIPDEGGTIFSYDLGWDRNEFLRWRHQPDAADKPLSEMFQEVFRQIESESRKTSGFSPEGGNRLGHSVFVSWSDENCWPEDSGKAIGKAMFPWNPDALPPNVIVY